MAEIKRVTLHPLNPDGTIDTNTNLYPKTLTTGIVNEEGEAVNFPDDNTLVHNSGNENIGGEKTFTNNVTIATPGGWAGLYLSTDDGQTLGFIETGEKGTKIVNTDNYPESPYYGKTASFIIDPRYGASFNLYDGKISFSQGAMQNPCSGYLQFKNINNVDELHLVTYSNDVQTDIVFPAGIDDRVELATKDEIPTNYMTIDTNQTINGYKILDRKNTSDPIITLIGGWGADAKTYDFKVSSEGLNIHRNGYVYVQFILKDGELQTQSLKPAGVSTSYNIGGPSNYGYYNLYLRNKIYSNNNDNYGLALPDTTSWVEHKTIATLDDVVAAQGTKLYKHHFDVVLTHADLALIPENSDVHIQVNALSTSGTPWATLGELDGGGFIVSAFGNVPNNYYYVFELKLFYAAVNALMVNFNNLISNSVTPYAVTSCGGGQAPSTWPIQDSVTPL